MRLGGSDSVPWALAGVAGARTASSGAAATAAPAAASLRRTCTGGFLLGRTHRGRGGRRPGVSPNLKRIFTAVNGLKSFFINQERGLARRDGRSTGGYPPVTARPPGPGCAAADAAGGRRRGKSARRRR